MFQREYKWQLHSAKHQFLNPTWPTEWHQFMAMVAYEYYMQTGDTQLASEYWDLLTEATYSQCADKSVSPTGLVDFSKCSRDSKKWPSTRDNVDWPINSRDGYVQTDINTEVNAFMVYSSRKLAAIGRKIGKLAEAEQLEKQANATADAMRAQLIDANTVQPFPIVRNDGSLVSVRLTDAVCGCRGYSTMVSLSMPTTTLPTTTPRGTPRRPHYGSEWPRHLLTRRCCSSLHSGGWSVPCTQLIPF